MLHKNSLFKTRVRLVENLCLRTKHKFHDFSTRKPRGFTCQCLLGCQAGFRPGRSSLDQILTLSQSIWDGFQKKKPPDRTILLLLTSQRLLTRSGSLLFFTNSSRSNSPLASFCGCTPSFLIVELKSRLVVPTAAPSASDVGSHRARFLVQSSSFCLLMTSLRIYLGMPMPPCMLTIWPSGPLFQTRSKPPLLSNPPSPS